jgi:outer membrane protein TolC
MKNNKNVLQISLTTALCFSVDVYAEKQALELHELLTKLNENPSLLMQSAKVDARSAYLTAIESDALPRVTFSGNGDVLSTGNEERLVEATVEYTLYDWGNQKSSVENANASLQAQAAQSKASLMELSEEVVRQYITITSSHQQIDVINSSINTLNNLKEIMARRVEQGVSPSSDLLLVESQIGQLKSAQIQLNGSKRDAQLSLLQLTGFKGNESQNMSCKAELEESSIVRLATDQSAALEAAQESAKSIQAKFGAVDSQKLPAIVIGANVSRDIDDSDNNARAFLSFRYNVDVGNRLDAELSELKADYSAAVYEEKRVADSTVRKAAGLVNQYRVSTNQIPILEDMINVRQEQLKSHTRRFSSGKSSWLDVINAQQDLTEAKLSSVDAHASQCLSLLTLEQMTGRNFRE